MTGPPNEHPQTTVAEAYLRQLRSCGIQNLYLNAGTDFAPIVDAYIRVSNAGELGELPTPVLAAHENLVAGMAHGAYLASGQPQAVMFHVSVGTANAACAAINAARDNVPLVITAGRTPVLESGAIGSRNAYVHWAQELFDQAGLLREVVKWDYELRAGDQVETVVARALAIATSNPPGPVYLSLPREVLAEKRPRDTGHATVITPPASPHPDPDAIADLADRLARANLPIIATSASGADPRVPHLLAELVEDFSVAVTETSPRYLNLPTGHPCQIGRTEDHVADADVVLVLESDVPWIPARARPSDSAFVAQAGRDPLYARYPIRGHRSDLSITCEPAVLLTLLRAELELRKDAINGSRAERIGGLAALRAHVAQRRADVARADCSAISTDLISSTLGELLPADAVVFNEYWADPELLGRTQPGTYFLLPAAGGLGWGLAAALGAKHARPERLVVAMLGDGAYLFGNPAACHHAASKHGLPVLTVIANNSRWNAVDTATTSVYPDLDLTAFGVERLSDLSPSPALHEYVAASGGCGELVTKPHELAEAIEQALDAVVVRGQQAVINVECQ